MTKNNFDKGMEVRREVLGLQHVDRAESKKDEFANLMVEKTK